MKFLFLVKIIPIFYVRIFGYMNIFNLFCRYAIRNNRKHATKYSFCYDFSFLTCMYTYCQPNNFLLLVSPFNRIKLECPNMIQITGVYSTSNYRTFKIKHPPYNVPSTVFELLIILRQNEFCSKLV